MGKVSIIIPSRNELFLQKTVTDLLSKGSDIEVIAVLDGYWPEPALVGDSRLKILHKGKAAGMRAAINSAAELATGEWLMKTDGHCMFAGGFDEVLKAETDEDWLAIPRRYSLEAELWERKPKAPIDYHYLDCPMTNENYFQFHGIPWNEMSRERFDDPRYEIDDLMSWQGSMWFMSRKLWERVGPMREDLFYTFSQEPQELGNKVWLSGGRIVVNKHTWYAHLHKGKQYGRGYSISGSEVVAGHKRSAEYWMSNAWPGQVRPIEWLIEKFLPLPTWPENWLELLENWRKSFVPDWERA